MEKLSRFSRSQSLRYLAFFCFLVSSVFCKEHVVLIHGLGRSSYSMKSIETFLEKNGYSCQSLSYPRRGFSFEEAVNILEQQIELKDEQPIHFIGHSLGGLLALYLRQKLPVTYQGLCITLGSPFGGSFYLDPNSVLYQFLISPFYGEIIQNLADHEKLREGIIERKNVFCICGDRCGYPMISVLYGLSEPHDCFVSTCSSSNFNCVEKIILPETHNDLLRSSQTLASCLKILNENKTLL